MKQILTLIAAAFIVTTATARVEPYKTHININAEKATLKISLQAAGKVNIKWTAIAAETTTTVYEIQKRTDDNGFKTIAILMGESYPTYSFRDKLAITSGIVEYRVVVAENNVVVSTMSQSIVVL